MPPRDWRLRVEDIIEATEKILRYTASMSFGSFVANELVVDAVIRNFEVIGEAAHHVPLEVQNQFPHLPWQTMWRMRNRVAHGYFDVDLAIVWQTIQDHLATLPAEIRPLLDSGA